MDSKHKEFKKLLENANKILIITHNGPDLDAFCSMLATYAILKKQYPKKDIVVKARQYPNINLPHMENMKIIESIDYEGEDLVIVTDIPELRLCVKDIDTIQNADVPFALIDHHLIDTDQSEWSVAINEGRSSATEQVYVTFKKIFGKKLIMNEDIATLLQYGIVADTNRFLYDGTSSDTHRLFAELKDYHSVDLDVFTYKTKKFPQESTPVIVEYLKSLKIEDDMSYMYISRKSIEENGFTKQGVNQAQAFLRDNYIRYMQGVHWGLIIRPSFSDEKMWDISFRSTKGYQDVQIIAKDLGGGGHTYSAATRISASSVEEVLQIVLVSVKKFVS